MELVDAIPFVNWSMAIPVSALLVLWVQFSKQWIVKNSEGEEWKKRTGVRLWGLAWSFAFTVLAYVRSLPEDLLNATLSMMAAEICLTAIVAAVISFVGYSGISGKLLRKT